ncbi:MAG: DNA adenine methylase [Anaerolineae bacterium]|jgi:hypothetical protein|nr:DNA adenine methylase [Anaerolineae bacterium]
MNRQRAEMTFKYNLKQGRHGWLRLTPAYSIQVVHQILDQHNNIRQVIDPFSGTGTTGLTCAERGIACDLYDLNPFLVWLAQVKTQNYAPDTLNSIRQSASTLVERLNRSSPSDHWQPPIYQIERWWDAFALNLLSEIYQGIQTIEPKQRDLLWIAFCRVLIQWSNAAFNHQSMSFKSPMIGLFDRSRAWHLDEFLNEVLQVINGASTGLTGQVSVTQQDSRHLQTDQRYDAVITSPPYPNRMSYIRELRPYMYWLGYLSTGAQAGDLDWQAIGGTWGVATSRLNQWQPTLNRPYFTEFLPLIQAIETESVLLARYVQRYFEDITTHVDHLLPHLTHGAKLFYIVGNSKFYQTLIPVEKIYAALFAELGLAQVEIHPLRKRNSKKELFEFMVSAVKI